MALPDPAWVGPSAWLQIDTERPGDVRAHVIDTTGLATSATFGLEAAPETALEGAATSFCSGQALSSYPRPQIITRAQWGAHERITRSSKSASGRRHAGRHRSRTTPQRPGVVMDGALQAFLEPFGFAFFRNGLVVATLVGALCGMIGVYVVLRA